MKQTDARRILRIARRIFIDIASARIARSMLPRLLRVAAPYKPPAFTPDYTGYGSYENVSGRFQVGNKQFTVENATFDVEPAPAGAAKDSLYFDWKGGTLTPNGDNFQVVGTFRHLTTTKKIKQKDATIKCKDATFDLTVNRDGKPFIEWRNGTWESGVWTNGFWHNGTWEGGQWWYGYWDKGVWKKGEQKLPTLSPLKDENGNQMTDKAGNKLNEYVWIKDDKDNNCPVIKRDTPPTKSYHIFKKNVADKDSLYSLDTTAPAGEWQIMDKRTGQKMQSQLYPPEVIDALNSQHLSGATSHDGRNHFMQKVDKIWDGILGDKPDIYRIYYNHHDRIKRSLYILYVNGYMQIFHMNENDQTLQKDYRILKPASHRPASLKDLYMLRGYDIFMGFIPTPDGKLLVQHRDNDGKFSHRIVQKAILFSRFKIFDPAALDRLFYEMQPNQSDDGKKEEIATFVTQWTNAINNLTAIYENLDKDADIYLGSDFDPDHGDIKEFFNSLTAMEKLQKLLKQESYSDKQSVLMEIKNQEKLRIYALNGEGCLTKHNLEEEWAKSSGPATPQQWAQYDKIMAELKETGDEIQKKISTLARIG